MNGNRQVPTSLNGEETYVMSYSTEKELGKLSGMSALVIDYEIHRTTAYKSKYNIERQHMKNIFSIIVSLSIFTMVFAGCAQTKQYTPQPIGTQYDLSGIPADLVRVQVNDLRAERENAEQLIQGIKGQILSALSTEQITGTRSLYSLKIDIIEHRSFFTLGNWNASTKFRIKLIDPENNMVGNWTAEGQAQRSNLWGYKTAKAVSQDAYNIAVADMMSTLSAVSLAR